MMKAADLKGVTIASDEDLELKSSDSEFYDCEIEILKECGLNHEEWLPLTYIAGFAMRGTNHKSKMKNADGYFLVIQKK